MGGFVWFLRTKGVGVFSLVFYVLQLRGDCPKYARRFSGIGYPAQHLRDA